MNSSPAKWNMSMRCKNCTLNGRNGTLCHDPEQLRPMLRLVLENENKVKQLLQIRMDELAKLVGQSSMQKSVLSTYGDQGGYVLAPQENLFEA